MSLGLLPVVASASSHREAPFISTMPTVDASDFYIFNSYEAGRTGYVTILANYNPLQNPGNGPIFAPLNHEAAYDINIDNSGDAKPDLVFRFRFTNDYKNLAVPAGTTKTPVPLLNVGPISGNNSPNLNRNETYTVTMYNGDPARGAHGQALKNSWGWSTFVKPVDNIGNKSLADYDDYAEQYIYTVNIPGCSKTGRVFVGQRKDGFVVNIGEIFDLVNLNPAGPRDAARNGLHNKNVDTLAMEVPKECLTAKNSKDPVIGGWTTSSLPIVRLLNRDPNGEENSERGFGPLTQVSRLANPLVNEVVIGMPDKDCFNASQPANDGQFLHYVTNPSLPTILNVLFGGAAKVPHTPRNDLATVFLTGIPGLNQPEHLTVPGEEMRLNTSIPAIPPVKQNDLGVLGGDLAGFPNGRRPFDDVVDIELRVAEGALCSKTIGTCGNETSDPNHGTPYTDETRSPGATLGTEHRTGAEFTSDTYLNHFPYLETPLPGSPNGKNGVQPDVAGSGSVSSAKVAQ